MTNYGVQYSTTRPKEIEITNTSVFLATDIIPYSKTIEGRIVEGFQYNYIQYSKDEYILKLHQDILDTQLALCDIYEALGVE